MEPGLTGDDIGRAPYSPHIKPRARPVPALRNQSINAITLNPYKRQSGCGRYIITTKERIDISDCVTSLTTCFPEQHQSR